jgi:hypothetical protein
VSSAKLSVREAEQLRIFERRGHDALAESYHAFFSKITARATDPLMMLFVCNLRRTCSMSRAGSVLLLPRRQIRARVQSALIYRQRW